MALSHSPKIVTDGLAFIYDTGDGKSYKGEPTTNLASDSPTQSGWMGTYSVVDSASKTFTITTRQDNSAYTSAWRTWYWSVSSYIGSYVTISANVEFVSETNCNFSTITIGQGNTGQFTTHIQGSDTADKVTVSKKPSTPIRMEWSGVINATGIVGFTLWIANVTTDGANVVLKLTNVQVEAKSHPTPFVNGTRSNTQGLLDRIGNSTITLSSMSYDSNAQMSFDGTDDYFQISDPNVSSSDGFSIEIVTKPENISSAPAIITPNSEGIDHFARFNSNGTFYFRMIVAADSSSQNFSTTTQLTDGNYHHILFTFKQSEGGKIYYNGELEYSAAADFTAKDWSSIWRIGQRGNGTWYYQGELPIIKVYNKVLTANEVAQNFNAMRGRFGI